MSTTEATTIRDLADIDAELLTLHDDLGRTLCLPVNNSDAEQRRREFLALTLQEIRRLQKLRAELGAPA